MGFNAATFNYSKHGHLVEGICNALKNDSELVLSVEDTKRGKGLALLIHRICRAHAYRLNQFAKNMEWGSEERNQLIKLCDDLLSIEVFKRDPNMLVVRKYRPIYTVVEGETLNANDDSSVQDGKQGSQGPGPSTERAPFKPTWPGDPD